MMATGDLAKDVVRHRVAGVSRNALEEHETAGDTAMWVLLAAGAISAYTWWRMVRDPRYMVIPTWLSILVVIGGLAAAGAASWASYEGGMIIHKEAHGAAPADTTALPMTP
ncbi:MAG TPA: hypothetical protein VGT98_09865 [Candidatus Elarobacter sp.]|nr:hypothetical protein [Candidatus Elarobacter sp.]